MEMYNLQKLIKISCFDFYRSNFYSYKSEIKLFGIIFRKEGVYHNAINSYYIGGVPENHVLKNGVVYEKPEVRLFFQSGCIKQFHFDDLNSAKKFANDITSNGNWI